jgi:hypothetical protein
MTEADRIGLIELVGSDHIAVDIPEALARLAP